MLEVELNIYEIELDKKDCKHNKFKSGDKFFIAKKSIENDRYSYLATDNKSLGELIERDKKFN